MDPENYLTPTKKRLSKAQLADEERMKHAIFTTGVIPFTDATPWATYISRMHKRTSEGKCSKCKKEQWPCKATLRQLNCHRGG